MIMIGLLQIVDYKKIFIQFNFSNAFTSVTYLEISALKRLRKIIKSSQLDDFEIKLVLDWGLEVDCELFLE